MVGHGQPLRPGDRDWAARRTSSTAALLAVFLLAVSPAGCTGEAPAPTATPAALVIGPLCDQLPTGDEPGAPEQLVGETADVALEWIPVLTVFEAATRATGLDAVLRDADGVTILAPTDEAFATTLGQDTIDDLLIARRDDLRDLLENHLIDGVLPLADLRDIGEVTTWSGEVRMTEPVDEAARIDGRARTVCADYRAANARIHVIDVLLGDLPAPAEVEAGGG